MRAVILPATPLLVPGLVPGLNPDPLRAVRSAVAGALGELTADGRLPLVLAQGTTLRHGRLRPSLASSGIGDRWLPEDLAAWPDVAAPRAGTAASVALLALADVLGARAAAVETLEVPPRQARLDDAVTGALRAATGLVVAGGGEPGGQDTGPGALPDGVRTALRLAGADTWDADVLVVEQAHDHLPREYRVTTLS